MVSRFQNDAMQKRATEETYVRERDKCTQRYGVREKESKAISKGQIQLRAVFYHIQCHYITYIQIHHNILTSTVCYTHLGPQINHSTSNIITRQMKSNHHMPSHPNAPTAAWVGQMRAWGNWRVSSYIVHLILWNEGIQMLAEALNLLFEMRLTKFKEAVLQENTSKYTALPSRVKSTFESPWQQNESKIHANIIFSSCHSNESSHWWSTSLRLSVPLLLLQ